MSIRALVGVALALGLSASAGFAACGGAIPASAPPPAVVSASATAPAATFSSAAAPDAGAHDGGDPALAAALAASRCNEPKAQIRNHPEGGVVFNNAMTSADAGALDRSQGVLDALATKLVPFRCCFDAWLGANPEREGTLMLELSLASDGTVMRAEVDPRRSNIDHPLTLGCVKQVAAATGYPHSPRGTPTLVEYPFVVGGAR